MSNDAARALHEAIVESLALPASSRVNQRVPKKMLAEYGGATATDRRLLTEGIEEAHWLAAIKPATAAVPAWRDEVREYLEVAVLSVELRASHARATQLQRLTELVHRAVPYPVLLILLTPGAVELSLAHKRAAQNEAGKVVLDGDIVSLALDAGLSHPASLLAALPVDAQPHTHLHALYQGWMDCLIAAQAERVTGSFSVAVTPDQAAIRRAALLEHQRLELEAARLRALAAKETQIAKRVEQNLALQRLQGELTAVRARLQ
ncbi:DUF4391 domain-containing protein [Variovorax sp. N23]|uniref:DUF4391 domain-containing protein n=1 Tax=Variovorax sp. N23 TaxID=2980555 RepID=UPI0021C9DC39|nr:DUF4391 domain-containing protein [Variovorax sp. N23]MCU4119735.1 DUF4391 domain-containing protein [Variovorax sp. N23]